MEEFSKNLNFRFGESGLFFKPTCSFLFGKQDFGSVRFKNYLDPRMAHKNYNSSILFGELARDLSSISKSLSRNCYLESADLHLEDAREEYVKQKNKISTNSLSHIPKCSHENKWKYR